MASYCDSFEEDDENDFEDFPGRLLHQAALWDNAELLEDLLNSDQLSHLNSRDSWGRTALHAAAPTEGSRCIKLLLQAGALADIPAGPRAEHKTALHMAAETGAVENIQSLLQYQANLLARDSNGCTALDLADKAQHTECCTVLKHAADARELARQELHIAVREACNKGDVTRARTLLRDLGEEAQVIINSAPNGANTLLFKSCEEGHKELVRVLLEYGADDRIHPVTKYSPLYIAAYYGRKDIVEILLKKFPSLASVCTVEKWLPLHACIINGHYSVLTQLLTYSYPEHLLHTYRDKNGRWEYKFAFDCNQRDVTGQSALYLASYCANIKMVELMLKLRLNATKIKTPEEIERENEIKKREQEAAAVKETCEPTPVTPVDNNKSVSEVSPTKSHKISGGIHALMSKLKIVKQEPADDRVCPFDIDLYCNSNTETALHVAVKNRHHSIVSLLLSSGANPNLRIYLPDDKMSQNAPHNYIFTGSTALVEACRNHDLGMVDMLLKNHARDDQCKALYIAAHNNDTIILSKLLALKAHPDPEYKIHKRCLEISPSQQFGPTLSISHSCGGVYAGVCPTTPVMINWHGQRCLPAIKDQWLIDASIQLNPKLRLSPRSQVMALYAITRLDISNNALTSLPHAIFSLPSLRILNAGQNKLDSLPILGASVAGAVDGGMTLPRRGNKGPSRHGVGAVLTGRYSNTVLPGCTVSVLEEIHLQDNRLDSLPEGIFSLPALQHLDVSNNKLSSLPYKMWCAPKLRELNLSLNLLSSLPLNPLGAVNSTLDEDSGSDSPRLRVSSFSSSKSGGASDLEVGGEGEEGGGTPAAQIRAKSSTGPGFSLGKHGNVITCCRQKEVKHYSLWTQAVQVQDSLSSSMSSDDAIGAGQGSPTKAPSVSCIHSLNLSHNAFSSIPLGLPCLAVKLARLNLSYNRLTDMGPAWHYPSGLKQLDLSHNDIASWPNLAQYSIEETENGLMHNCWGPHGASKTSTGSTQGSNRTPRSNRSSSSLHGLCPHKRHVRLENLKTLVLSDNKLTRLCLYLEEGQTLALQEAPEDIAMTSSSAPSSKGRLVFPVLSMLDVSNNALKELPTSLHHLTSLAVLNVSGNTEIQELPPEMGLLSRMWNLNTRGCSLQDPLKTMIESKKYKTMDVIGYLKSILEDARPYARMKLMIVGLAGIGKTSLLDSLRQEGTGSYRKKPVEHWASRMGNRNITTRTSRGGSMSTVGVDISDWTYEKKVRGQSNHGAVVFRTWDFGGQKEYYATHQYFLSKRSLYIVVWKIIDGEKAIDGILQWLVNIQARAPNSAVLIVGTHYDLVRQKYSASWSEDLQQIIRDRFINVIDADKLGLPRVLDTIEVSCKSRHNIKLLCNLIYDTVFSLKTPGSKERLLEQRIPASYLALEDVVCSVAMERRLSGKDPVLSSERYQSLVAAEMTSRGLKPFRDKAELNQATTFLHENGVLLHYDDATLKELYFLDPQWLCDMLAHVVTIREINPFAKNGLMKLDDLKHVFKTSSCAPVDAKSYIVSLLNKFEVALTWDNRTLLIPSLLPSEEQMRCAPKGCDVSVKIPLKSRGWGGRRKRFSGSNLDEVPMSYLAASADATASSKASVFISHRSSPLSAIRRLLLMSYFPSGFWPRFITRILADEGVLELLKNYFVMPNELGTASDLIPLLGGDSPEWVCWQSGIELHYANTLLIRISEKSSTMMAHASIKESPLKQQNTANINHDYKGMRFLVKQEDVWSDVEIKDSAVLEVVLPNEAVVLRRSCFTGEGTLSVGEDGDVRMTQDPFGEGIQSVVLDPALECVTKLLSIAVDHIDTLLEDWYPTLGTRFVHTSEGKLLITRLIPCPVCLDCQGTHPKLPPHVKGTLPDSWGSFVEMNPLYCSMTGSMIASQGPQASHPPIGVLKEEESPSASSPPPVMEVPPASPARRSMQSFASDGGDSGVGPDSNSSSRNPSAEGAPHLPPTDEEPPPQELTPVVYSFLVEECILAAYTPPSTLTCPLHSSLMLAQIAPDTVFLDLGDHHLISQECIKQGKLLGRGGFGFVFQGTVKHNLTGAPLDVALKMLQPVDPGHTARTSAIQAYKACASKWERDPQQYACKAYCSARQEVNIILSLKHPNIVPLVGVCPRPLAIVLELAPQGALDHCLKHYQRSGARLSLYTLQVLVLQVAKALEYLHGQHIIYRDLKSENVLVWDLPVPHSELHRPRVDVKLADYGISRASLPTGTKGFGGTEGFMAPEMMRFNGEEEYTEKVDVFSFGMFLYELFTTHQPYEQCDNVKELVLEGDRPPLSQRETGYPLYLIDLMVLCWASTPKLRPTASQIVSIASAPEFSTLVDVTVLDHNLNIMCAVATPAAPVSSMADEDSVSLMEDDFFSPVCPLGSVWVSRTSPQLDMLGVGGSAKGVHSSATPPNAYGQGAAVSSEAAEKRSPSEGWSSYHSIEGLPETITAMCLIEDTNVVWLGDNCGSIHGYSVLSNSRLFSYSLECDASVRAMAYLYGGSSYSVAVAASNGRLFLCSSHIRGEETQGGDINFVVTELNSDDPTDTHCLGVTRENDTWKVWCGGSNSSIKIFSLRSDGLMTSHSTVNHVPTVGKEELNKEESEEEFTSMEYVSGGEVEQKGDVLLIHSSETNGGENSGSIWSYVYPGCVVYHWDAVNQCILNKLDCSKLVPCSESLQSISIEEHLSPSHCQVSAMSVCGRELYVGTTWGCIIVAEALSMRPITVFRPYQDEVRAILPIIPSTLSKPESRKHSVSSAKTPTSDAPKPIDAVSPSGSSVKSLASSFSASSTSSEHLLSDTGDQDDTEEETMVVTFGRGYRNLLSRYAPMPKSMQQDPNNRQMYALLWRANAWNN